MKVKPLTRQVAPAHWLILGTVILGLAMTSASLAHNETTSVWQWALMAQVYFLFAVVMGYFAGRGDEKHYTREVLEVFLEPAEVDLLLERRAVELKEAYDQSIQLQVRRDLDPRAVVEDPAHEQVAEGIQCAENAYWPARDLLARAGFGMPGPKYSSHLPKEPAA